jgi:hypothetical protein
MTVSASLIGAREVKASAGVTSLGMPAGSTNLPGKISKGSRANHHLGHKSLAGQIGYLETAASICASVMVMIEMELAELMQRVHINDAIAQQGSLYSF